MNKYIYLVAECCFCLTARGEVKQSDLGNSVSSDLTGTNLLIMPVFVVDL